MSDVKGTSREIHCPDGGFISNRYLLEEDNMGFTLTNTFIPSGKEQVWHYKNHMEACLCISGDAEIINLNTGEDHHISIGTMYALDKNDPHLFRSFEDTTLICVFNPPLRGGEVHKKDGSY